MPRVHEDAGYNPAWLGRMQYCFEHLKRDGKDILEKGVKDEKGRALLEELSKASSSP